MKKRGRAKKAPMVLVLDRPAVSYTTEVKVGDILILQAIQDQMKLTMKPVSRMAMKFTFLKLTST